MRSSGSRASYVSQKFYRGLARRVHSTTKMPKIRPRPLQTSYPPHCCATIGKALTTARRNVLTDLWESSLTLSPTIFHCESISYHASYPTYYYLLVYMRCIVSRYLECPSQFTTGTQCAREQGCWFEVTIIQPLRANIHPSCFMIQETPRDSTMNPGGRPKQCPKLI